MTMTTDAKHALSTTIRSLRARLLADLHDATESAYRLALRIGDAGLDEAARAQRERLTAWTREQVRTQDTGRTGSTGDRTEADFRREAEKQAAYTLLNRLVLLRLMEEPGPSGIPLREIAVVTGGWESPGYQTFRDLAPGIVRGDETEGYAFLLRLVFEDLATELPGLYGPAGVADLIPVPAGTLRHVIDALGDPALATCWADDMTLGWVYQYWNDPEREALDDKLNSGGKVEPHEIASKTQMFTERYMVDWLLHNSLGPMWLAICQRHGWTPEVQADGTLDRLEERRAGWRARRVAGEVALTDLMPLHTGAERHWAYYVPQPIPADAVAQAPETVRDLKLLDPAVGSGHFLVVALDLLVALYREEARHRGEDGTERWSDRAIVERIVSHNLHGIDLDPRAVQITAAALWLKAQQVAPGAHPERLNLVASSLRLASLADDDPALVELRHEVERETGIPGTLTDRLIYALRGADYLGSLLKVDHAVDAALEQHEAELGRVVPEQGDLFAGFSEEPKRVAMGRAEARETLLDRLESFLAHHTGGDDLGLRLRGEQLAAGVRFVRLTREGTYDLVVANPPYQRTSKMLETAYLSRTYPLGKANLYSAFLLRGLELVRKSGVSAMLTMRDWMFLKQYSGLREYLLGTFDLRSLGDFAVGAFDEVPNDILSVTVSVIHRSPHRSEPSMAHQPTPPGDNSYDRARTRRKRAAALCQEGCHSFDSVALKIVPEWPIIYWWGQSELGRYQTYPLASSSFTIFPGVVNGDHDRFLRRWFEVPSTPIMPAQQSHKTATWPSYIKGAAGFEWFEPVQHVAAWANASLELRVFGAYCNPGTVRPRDPSLFFRPGIAHTTIGSTFSARAHRIPGVFDNKGPTSFPENIPGTLCLMNSAAARSTLSALNPGLDFTIADIGRLPVFEIEDAASIFGLIDESFAVHESHREPSVEFRRPGPSSWRHAQEWAQTAIDRPEGAPLPDYTEQLDPEPATDHLSFALGVALSRFGPADSPAEGILEPTIADLSHALPHGILFLDTTLDAGDHRDGLGHPAAAPLHTAWAEYGAAVGTRRSLRDWLALDFFKDVHKNMYEGRPIHWPLSSANRTFVAWVNIHRMTAQTLGVLLADHLMPALARFDGEVADLRAVRDGADKKAARSAEQRLAKATRARDELREFIAAVEQCADRGAPPADGKCPPREQDARYAPNLDDGVMINSAALWPLLDPQWKEPKKWWAELAVAKGRKDYDWSHLAMRYWPERVDRKAQQDPSLGVAHGCFWRYHPARAWTWELRLQDEIGPDFRIEEGPYRPGGRDLGDPDDGVHRDNFLFDQPQAALAAIEREAIRRMGRGKGRRTIDTMPVLEGGLWTRHAADLWQLELDLAEKQGVEIRITAPDEPAARAAFEADNPDLVAARKRFLAALVPPAGIFGDEDPDADAGADGATDADGDEEDGA
jgi:hypothetical protein